MVVVVIVSSDDGNTRTSFSNNETANNSNNAPQRQGLGKGLPAVVQLVIAHVSDTQLYTYS